MAKNSKRPTRVPKGCMSSNSAYTLVYKRASATGRSDSKDTNLKKTDVDASTSEGSSSNDSNSDNQREFKRKNSDSIRIADCKKTWVQKKRKMDANKNAGIDGDEFLMENKENADKCNAASNYETTSEEVPKVESNSDAAPQWKLNDDYSSLNGAAHRAMGCRERDAYETVSLT